MKAYDFGFDIGDIRYWSLEGWRGLLCMAKYLMRLLPEALCKGLGCTQVNVHRKPGCFNGSRITDWKGLIGRQSLVGVRHELFIREFYIKCRKCKLSSSKNGTGKATELWGPKAHLESPPGCHVLGEVVFSASHPLRAVPHLTNASLRPLASRATCSWAGRLDLGWGPGILGRTIALLLALYRSRGPRNISQFTGVHYSARVLRELSRRYGWGH